MSRFLLAALFTLIIAFWLIASPYERAEHQVFLGGEILLPGGETAEAVYIHDGRIAAIGSRADMLEIAPWGADRIDLDGGTLTAGLIEPHTHPLAAALLGAAVDVSGITYSRREDMMAALREAAAQSGPSPWVIAFGWDPAMIRGLEPPTLAELDALAPDRPLVILTQMMHEAFVNTAALQAANIHAATPDPLGGRFERDVDGNPTGRIIEVSAIRVLMEAAPEAPDAALSWLLFGTLNEYARSGYTTIGVASLVGRARDPLALFAEVSQARNAPLNSVLYTAPDRAERARDMWSTVDQQRAISRHAGIKFWMDGSPYVGGAALAQPYARSPFTEEVIELPEGWHGELLTDQNTARQLIRNAEVQGLQVAIHAQGEDAIDAILNAIEVESTGEIAHRLEHLALITPEQIARAETLDVSLGFFIDHIRYYGHMLPDLVGDDRTDRYMPVRSALEGASTVTLHADSPATPINAMRVFQTAVERISRASGIVVAADQRVTRQQALDMMTIHAARQLGIDDETGSIEIGKRADFTWLSANPLTAEDLVHVEVRGTWISGRRADTRSWSRPALAHLVGAILAVVTG
ncbi:amidohydrolase [Maricaulis sp. MIT060901]|uniref:amidohydrolase n=1 Tax=Maricaulis sp. MIT060901 TaxID=3096993 RepID=UPI00399C0091